MFYIDIFFFFKDTYLYEWSKGMFHLQKTQTEFDILVIFALCF